MSLNFVNTGKICSYLNANGAPVSAYLHTDGVIYYLVYIAGTGINLVKITADGTNSIVQAGITVTNDAVYDAVGVPYDNLTTGHREVHFVLGRTADGVVGSELVKLEFAGATPVVSVVDSTGLSVDGVDAGTVDYGGSYATYTGQYYAYTARQDTVKPVWINKNTELAYMRIHTGVPGGSTTYMQKYDPATTSWTTLGNNISLPVWIGRMNFWNDTVVWCVGDYVYVHGYDDNSSNASWIDRIHIPSMATSIWWNAQEFVNTPAEGSIFTVANDVLYKIGGASWSNRPTQENPDMVDKIATVSSSGECTATLADGGYYTFSKTTIPNYYRYNTPANALYITGGVMMVGGVTENKTNLGDIIIYNQDPMFEVVRVPTTGLTATGRTVFGYRKVRVL